MEDIFCYSKKKKIGSCTGYCLLHPLDGLNQHEKQQPKKMKKKTQRDGNGATGITKLNAKN